MDRLAALASEGATDYHGGDPRIHRLYSQRGLVVIISDFLDDRGCERALQYLADFGHELMLLQIWADEDRTPPWTGELELRDAETGAGSSWISTTRRGGDTPTRSTNTPPRFRPWRIAAADATREWRRRNRSRA
jgi:hypothetical protein